MKAKTNTTGWEINKPTAEFVTKHPASELDVFNELRADVAEIAKANGWNKAEICRRTNIANSTFTQWFSGQYLGTLENINAQVEQWLKAASAAKKIEDHIPSSPGFIDTRLSRDIFDTLIWAQALPDLVMITCGAGMGKTAACRQYEATRPHVYMATVSENTKTVHGMLVELAAELDVTEHNPARLARAIGNKLRRMGSGTLLIVDEGQHLDDAAINQLRHFVDVYQCGVAVVGNKEVYDRFHKGAKGRSYDQMRSRIGKRLQIDIPHKEDILLFIDEWGVSDEDARTELLGIGLKGGALRQIDKTMKLATMLANGLDQELDIRHIQKAWKNRNVGDLS